MVCILVAVAIGLFSGSGSEMAGSEEEGALAGNAKALPVPRVDCRGRPDGHIIDLCPTTNGLQRYCQDGRTETRQCPTCQGAVPSNTTLCAGDDEGLVANANRVAVASCTNGAKCEYACSAGNEFQNGRCVSRELFCREVFSGGRWDQTGVSTHDGDFQNRCEDGQQTYYSCRGPEYFKGDYNCPWSLSCDDRGVNCCRPFSFLALAEGQGITGPVTGGNVSAINLRCEGSIFVNESRTTCSDEPVTLQSDCGERGCLVQAPPGGHNGCQ